MKLTKLTLAQSHDCEKDTSEGVILSRLVLVISLSLHLVLSQKDLKASWKKDKRIHFIVAAGVLPMFFCSMFLALFSPEVYFTRSTSALVTRFNWSNEIIVQLPATSQPPYPLRSSK